MGLLEGYRRKRRFDVTPEPRGGRGRSGRALRYVIQKHDASRLHYDFRLELDGVLKSWAVPKGPSDDPTEKRLAVEVEDHPLDYASFEGRIPAGQYGAGTVEIWDQGRWKPEGDPRTGLREGSLTFVLEGQRLRGRWSLVRMSGRAAARARTPQWLLIKSRDRATPAGASEPQARRTTAGLDAQGKPGPLPRFVRPQLATLVETVPDDDGWLHEIKYDGYRIQARLDHGKVALRTRSGLDWTAHFPGVAQALAGLRVETALLDGEVAVLGSDGVTHFQLLQNAGRSVAKRGPVYYVFDLLHWNGRDLTGRPLEDRKRTLATLVRKGGPSIVRYSDHVLGHGERFHREACARGLEGIISKRREGLYTPGRSRDWVKGKCRPRQEFVIGGYTDPAGSRKGFGALLLGAHDTDRQLHCVGRVGTGFDDPTLASLLKRLRRIASARTPFVNPPRGRGIHWVRPELVAEVSFATWTDDRQLRQASFEGLREDKAASEVRLEREERTPKASRAAKPARRSPANPRLAAPSSDEGAVAGVEISHPTRLIFTPEHVTKVDLARYLEAVSPWMLPHVVDRPLMILRCNQGVGAGHPCFVQKHPARTRGAAQARDPSDAALHLAVRDVAGLVRLVQNGAVEIHTWGATLRRIERPDRLIFDLDPHESVPWVRVVELARELRVRLRAWRLPAYVKTSGGLGLHVLVPLEPRHSWSQVRDAAAAMAEEVVRQASGDVTLEIAKHKRSGKIFLDILRNVRGATCVAPYSPRARAGAPISLPLSWEQLAEDARPEAATVPRWTRGRRGSDPWRGWEGDRARLPSPPKR